MQACKTSRFCRQSGSGNSTFRSNLPGRISAGSSISGRLVAMITFTFVVWSNPSICVSSSIRILCTSRSPPIESFRFNATASIYLKRPRNAHLVDEDDARRVFPRFAEHIAHHARSVAQPSSHYRSLARLLLHELAGHHLNEIRRRCVRHRLRQHRFPRSGGTVHQNLALRGGRRAYAPRGIDSDLREDLGVEKRKLDGFAELLLLHIQASDVLVGHRWLLRHDLDVVVRLGRKNVHHGARTGMDADAAARLEQIFV